MLKQILKRVLTRVRDRAEKVIDTKFRTQTGEDPRFHAVCEHEAIHAAFAIVLLGPRVVESATVIPDEAFAGKVDLDIPSFHNDDLIEIHIARMILGLAPQQTLRQQNGRVNFGGINDVEKCWDHAYDIVGMLQQLPLDARDHHHRLELKSEATRLMALVSSFITDHHDTVRDLIIAIATTLEERKFLNNKDIEEIWHTAGAPSINLNEIELHFKEFFDKEALR